MLKHDGSGRLLPPGFWWVLVWLLFCFIFLLVGVSMNYAQTQTDYLNSIEQKLTILVEKSAKLEEEVKTWQASSIKSAEQARQLQLDLQMQSSELQELRKQAAYWHDLSVNLYGKAKELQGSLESLQQMHDQLGKSFDASVASWNLALKKADRQRRAWKTAALLSVPAGLLLGGLAGWAISSSSGH